MQLTKMKVNGELLGQTSLVQKYMVRHLPGLGPNKMSTLVLVEADICRKMKMETSDKPRTNLFKKNILQQT